MDPIALLATALAGGLVQVGGKLLEESIVKPALEPATNLLRTWVQRGYDAAGEDRALLGVMQAALAEAGAPTKDNDDLAAWFQQVGLDRLVAKRNDALRRQMARAVLSFTDLDSDPPRDLVVALGWPRSRERELSNLLSVIRSQLAALDRWRPPIEYADRMAQLRLLRKALERLAWLDNLIVPTEAGGAIRVAVSKARMTMEEAAAIEASYRAELVKELMWHDFRGIVQIKRDIRLPLEDVYLEPGLLRLEDGTEQRQNHERLLELAEAERMAAEERRLQERVTDALEHARRLVVLGGPGAGKTVSLRFIGLMLAHGYGAARLGLDIPFVPLVIRLADYARELEQDSNLSLFQFLQSYVGKAYDADPRLSDFFRLALGRGVCMVLLDGLDEVGDDLAQGQVLRTRVVGQVQKFVDYWCDDNQRNRVVVTSRIEGYWNEPIRNSVHVQLSPLRPPDEVEAFLLRWYTAHEQAHGEEPDRAERRAQDRVSELLPHILESPGVRRLATNPLLLTILALIHENVGRLPNRRVRLYEICTQTLIESWRQAQTRISSKLLTELGEEAVIRVMAPLAYWLHNKHPGGTATYQEWEKQLASILEDEGYEQPQVIADSFLRFVRFQAGLLAERGLGRFGFFHLTFEEYLAAREIARKRMEERRELLRAHWEDPRWHEIILLAAGQLGIVEARRDDVSDFIEDILKMEPQRSDNNGRQAVLAGRALADIGQLGVTKATRRWVLRALEETMQDRDPDTGRLNDPPLLSVRTRYDAGEILDELGWLPEDLNRWIRCPGCAHEGGDLMTMKYPVTNEQYGRFIEAGGYENREFWNEDGWRWRWTAARDYRVQRVVTEPKHWRDARFGEERRGYPVVGVSWYEAQAFCRWLTDLLWRAQTGVPYLEEKDRALVADLIAAEATEVRLPAEKEWKAITGEVQNGTKRYPWDPPVGSETKDEKAILARANVLEAELGGTSPVGMYPLGASYQFGLMGLAGNVWEWAAVPWQANSSKYVVHGGSWLSRSEFAYCAFSFMYTADYSYRDRGFRCVSPITVFNSQHRNPPKSG